MATLRIGEATRLRRSEVDVTAGTIRIANNVVELASKLHEGPPKAAGRRTMRLPSSLVNDLADHIDRFSRATYVFTRPDGEVLHAEDYRTRHWRPAAKRPVLLHCGRTTSNTPALLSWRQLVSIRSRSRAEPDIRACPSPSTATVTCFQKQTPGLLRNSKRFERRGSRKRVRRSASSFRMGERPAVPPEASRVDVDRISDSSGHLGLQDFSNRRARSPASRYRRQSRNNDDRREDNGDQPPCGRLASAPALVGSGEEGEASRNADKRSSEGGKDLCR